jgi:hypothetical protein
LESVLYELFLSALLPAGEGDEQAADGEGEKEGEKEGEGEERWAAYDELLGRLLTRLLAKTDAKVIYLRRIHSSVEDSLLVRQVAEFAALTLPSIRASFSLCVISCVLQDKGVTALLLCAPRVPLSAVDSLQEALLDKSGARYPPLPLYNPVVTIWSILAESPRISGSSLTCIFLSPRPLSRVG